MAVDKKSDYLGNHGGRYVDSDGLSKQFTYVDHDKKTTISTFTAADEQQISSYREDLIGKILAIPPVYCTPVLQDFTLRGDERQFIEWNETMLKDEGVPLDRLRDIYTLSSNRMSMLKQGINP